MTQDELEQLREGWDFEAKKAGGRDGNGALPESLWETYSAFANTQGGKILLGAKERSDGTLELFGINDVAKVTRDLWTTLQNRNKVSANILKQADVEELEVDGKHLLLVSVPQAPRGVRPVYLNNSIEEGTFVRINEGDHLARPDVARRMYAERINERDSQAVPEFSLSDLHAESVSKYRQLLSSAKPGHVFLTKPDPEFLEAIGAAAPDTHGVMRPTWAGMWMLGNEIKLRRLLPHWHLSYKELPSDPADRQRWTDRIHPDGTWNANLFEFYLRVSPKLLATLKVPFALAENQTRIDETNAQQALREALVNTLVHADHQGTTGIRITSSTKGFEFINPGLLLVRPEQFWKGGVSEARNPALQRLFSTLQLGEREGSGGPAMQQAWASQHFRAPTIRLDPEHSDTHLELPLESLLPAWAAAEAMRRLGHQYQDQDQLGRVLLVTAIAEKEISHGRAVELGGSHSRDVTLKLQELMRKHLLASRGSAKKKLYFVPEDTSLPEPETIAIEGNARNGGSSEPNGGSSAKGGSSNVGGTANDVSTTPAKPGSAANDASSIPGKTSLGAKGGSSAKGGSFDQSVGLPRGGSSVAGLAANGGSSGANGGSSGANGGSSGANGGSSGARLTANGGSPVPRSAGNGGSSDVNGDTSLGDKPLVHDVGSALLRVQRSQRASSELMQAAILEFCKDRYRTPQEIAQALRRGAKTLKSNYLPHLIAAGLLEPLYPDSPTHPQQAYRMKKELA